MPAEHAALYQYNLANAQNHYIGFAQTETVSDRLIFHFRVVVDTIPSFSRTINLSLLLQRHLVPLPLITIPLTPVISPQLGPCTCNHRPTPSSLVSSATPIILILRLTRVHRCRLLQLLQRKCAFKPGCGRSSSDHSDTLCRTTTRTASPLTIVNHKSSTSTRRRACLSTACLRSVRRTSSAWMGMAS